MEKGPVMREIKLLAWRYMMTLCMTVLHRGDDDIVYEMLNYMVPKWSEPDFLFIGGCPSCSSFEGDHDFDIC